MNNTIFIILVIFLFGCGSENTSQSNDKGNKERNFFFYDEIDHYRCLADKHEVAKLYEDQSKSLTDSIKMGIVLGDIPASISDSLFIPILEQINYKRNKINKSTFDRLDSIFSKKEARQVVSTACIYIYRDILVLRKKSKIVGVIKICFDCMGIQIIGANTGTEFFGQDDDYRKLEGLLKSEN